MNIESVLKVSIIFLIGFLSANFMNIFLAYGFERPLPAYFGLSSLTTKQTPHDMVKEDQIVVEDDKVVINIKGASLSKYAATGSMIPTLNENSNGIRIVPNSEEDIKVGDIITFYQDNILIVHRVVEKGVDENGTYFITKGDNNNIEDGKIRFKDIKYLTIGIIW